MFNVIVLKIVGKAPENHSFGWWQFSPEFQFSVQNLAHAKQHCALMQVVSLGQFRLVLWLHSIFPHCSHVWAAGSRSTC